jgi:hypothetical protein
MMPPITIVTIQPIQLLLVGCETTPKLLRVNEAAAAEKRRAARATAACAAR